MPPVYCLLEKKSCSMADRNVLNQGREFNLLATMTPDQPPKEGQDRSEQDKRAIHRPSPIPPINVPDGSRPVSPCMACGNSFARGQELQQSYRYKACAWKWITRMQHFTPCAEAIYWLRRHHGDSTLKTLVGAPTSHRYQRPRLHHGQILARPYQVALS